MNIDELIASSAGKLNVREYLEHPDFSTLYVRVTTRYINNQYVKTIDLANLEAKNPGNGSFKKLVNYLLDKYPEYTLYVECVLTERFQKGLIKMGFTKISYYTDCYYMSANV